MVSGAEGMPAAGSLGSLMEPVNMQGSEAFGFEADAGEDQRNLVVPVSGTAAEAVQSFLE